MSFHKIKYLENGCIVNDVLYTIEELEDLYIKQNIPQVVLAQKLNITRTSLIQIIKHFELFKDPEVVKKNRKQAIFDKYGTNSVMSVPEIREKSQRIIQEKYGAKSALVNPEIKEKTRETLLRKYGVDHPSKSKKIIKEKKEKYFSEFGVYNHWQKNINHFDIWNDKAKLESFLQSFGKNKPTYIELGVYFNVDRTAINYKILDLDLEKYINIRPGYSQYEDEIVMFLKEELGISENQIQRNVVGLLEDSKLEIDIYLSDFNIGIEFNGDYWHSDLFCTDHSGRSTYHQEKSLLAEESGIFLFHIFEYEWNNPETKENICNRLKILLKTCDKKISGRECSVIKLTKDQKKDFLNKYHIQGNDHSSVCYGLEYQGEVVSCMSFVIPKNKKYNWELSRFCSKHGCIIRGGASKLFKYFISTLNIGDKIVSYNDITKTKGTLYKILGFSLKSINDPNYVWINFRTKDIRTRYQEQKAGEVKRMHDAGYHRVCDCGTKTWIYEIK